jgi:hypothetical protein
VATVAYLLACREKASSQGDAGQVRALNADLARLGHVTGVREHAVASPLATPETPTAANAALRAQPDRRALQDLRRGVLMAGTLTITGLATGMASGEKIIGPLTLTGSATIGTVTDLALAVGDNATPVPAAAAAVLIVLTAANTAAVRVRTSANASDTGLPLGTSGWAVIPLPAGVTTLTLTASSAGSAEMSFI